MANYQSELATAKAYIARFIWNSYEEIADFSKLSRIPLAYTEKEADEHAPARIIEVFADLERFWICGVISVNDGTVRESKDAIIHLSTSSYRSLSEMNQELLHLTFDGLVEWAEDEMFRVDDRPNAVEYVNAHQTNPTRRCNRCGSPVLISDNGGSYSYQCMSCNEDLFSFETHDGDPSSALERYELVKNTHEVMMLD